MSEVDAAWMNDNRLKNVECKCLPVGVLGTKLFQHQLVTWVDRIFMSMFCTPIHTNKHLSIRPLSLKSRAPMNSHRNVISTFLETKGLIQGNVMIVIARILGLINGYDWQLISFTTSLVQ